MRVYYDDGQVQLWHGDSAEYVGPPGDLILTDPPYAGESLPLWGLLREIAARSLTPGGWLLAYSGKAFLPGVLAALEGPDLTYRWCGAVSYVGDGQILHIDELTLLAEWKPILVYRRPPFGSPRGPGGRYMAGGRTGFRDVLVRGGRAKHHHPWGQPVAESIELLSRFSKPGDVILDPFAGSGTTLVAATAVGLRAIGIEIEEQWCERAAIRCSQEVLGLGVEAPHQLEAMTQLEVPA